MTESSRWQLSGSASEAYERYIVQAFMQGWTHALIETANLAAGACVLDVACGTGVVARLVATRLSQKGRVVGVDLNKGMLATARMLPQSLSGVSVEWREGNVAALPFPEATFDAVLC